MLATRPSADERRLRRLRHLRMRAADIVTDYWRRVQARDWRGVAALLDPEVVMEWPVTAECFRGREAVVAVNAEYPEGWDIRVLSVVGEHEQARARSRYRTRASARSGPRPSGG